MDFCKAFDTVDHGMLQQKLQCSDLLVDYLRNSHQYVNINGANSDTCIIIEYGVLQGSLLSPRLLEKN